MSCSRCGSNKPVRPTPPPSVVSRPGTMVPSPGKNTTGGAPDAHSTITGLRYVPSSTNK